MALMDDKRSGRRQVSHHIFGGSTAMIGVCITITSLFKVLNKSNETYMDNVIGIDTSLFIASALISYLALRDEKYDRLERWADLLFFVGMIIILIVGLMLVFTDL
jgi:hypothetical protein